MTESLFFCERRLYEICLELSVFWHSLWRKRRMSYLENCLSASLSMYLSVT